MKTINYAFVTLLITTVLFFLTGCTSEVKILNNSTLQIMGLNEGSVIEGDSTSKTLYFTYNFGNNGALNIHQLSEDDYKNDIAKNPIEKNIGQFGLFALAHAQSTEDKIVYGDIKFNVAANCGNQPLNLPNFGNMPTFNDLNGKKSIDLSRNLQLPEFVSNMHHQLNLSYPNCLSLEEMAERPEQVLNQKITLRMNIIFNYATKSGAKNRKEYTLIFKPSLPIKL